MARRAARHFGRLALCGEPSCEPRSPATQPAVVVLMICSRDEAERYSEAAQPFVDLLFFQEGIAECLAFRKKATGEDR